MTLGKILWAIIIPVIWVAGAANLFAIPFGPPFNSNPDSSWRLNDGEIWVLNSLSRVTEYVDNSGALLQNDIRFYHPDLVTDGQEVILNSQFAEATATRLLWRGRPWRSLRTGRAELQLLPPLFMGNVCSTTQGTIGGYTAAGGLIEFTPQSPQTDQPITHLHHQDGYYHYAPVEFLHARRAGPRTFVLLSGGFPSSWGIYPNSYHRGQALSGEILHTLSPTSTLSASLLDNRQETGIPFAQGYRLLQRSDCDIIYTNRLSADAGYEAALWRVDESERFKTTSGLRRFGQEYGIRLHGGNRPNTGLLRLSLYDVELEKGRLHNQGELEASFVRRGSWRGLKWWAQIGGWGWLPKGVRWTGAVSGEYYRELYGRFSLTLQQAVNPLSPEVIAANYQNNRPADALNQAWDIYAHCAVQGRILPVPLSRGLTIAWNNSWGIHSLGAQGFLRQDLHTVYWDCIGDSPVQPNSLDPRWVNGGLISWNIDRGPFRHRLDLYSARRIETESDNHWFSHLVEHDIRAQWELGWHDSFWNDQFEADALIGGSLFNNQIKWDRHTLIGTNWAYPLRFQATMRIQRFTLYWGLRNWNDFPFQLVPGYRMMHKEEYWGIYWTLLD
ncbi:MAG: hypothetical protein V2A61_05480 [Calditrichota bacterium]